MRKLLVGGLGLLLVLCLATTGYPAQGTAAVQASGDITLKFGIMSETEFEVRDNYDLDNGLTDGCSGTDCSGVTMGTESARDAFVEQETRLIFEGSQGDVWKVRVVLESETLLEGRDEQADMDLERAWAASTKSDSLTMLYRLKIDRSCGPKSS